MKIILSIVSVVWTLLGAYLLSLSGGCDAQDASKVFQCLSANELGDFLAGFFAPLAFLWVAYAVIIQSQELAAQREELKLTRNELELTREVAIEAKDATRAQAEEARRSGEYFEAQTDLMREERSMSVADAASEKLERLLLTIRGQLGKSLLGAEDYRRGDKDIREWFANHNQALNHTTNHLAYQISTLHTHPSNVERLETAIAALPAISAALDLEKQLGPEDLSILRTIDIVGLYDALSLAKADLEKFRVADALKSPDSQH